MELSIIVYLLGSLLSLGMFFGLSHDEPIIWKIIWGIVAFCQSWFLVGYMIGIKLRSSE